MTQLADSSAQTFKRIVQQVDREIDWHWLAELSQWVLEQAIAIQQIPAPTFHESHRAAYVKIQFEALGLEEVWIDDLHNVYGLLAGEDPNRSGLMILAHLDTVFASDTDLQNRREGNIVFGPGLGDNSVGVAAVLGLAEALRREKLTSPCNLWLVATSREEGLGDLGGMKAAYAHLRELICGVINIEGLALGHIYFAGIAVRRLHITATAAGGHSWLHFGRASALHGIIELGAQILAIQPPQEPRTTYNIGMVQGGHAINAIATRAEIWLDMRSETPETLAELEQKVRTLVNAAAHEDLNFSVAVVGDRPAGRQSLDAPLVQGALAALERVGLQGALEIGSTDGNISLADGCPTVTLGITRGGNAHRLDEYIEVEPIASGLRQLIILVLAACQAN
jgi:tripeptide aminopeptidase